MPSQRLRLRARVSRPRRRARRRRLSGLDDCIVLSRKGLTAGRNRRALRHVYEATVSHGIISGITDEGLASQFVAEKLLRG